MGAVLVLCSTRYGFDLSAASRCSFSATFLNHAAQRVDLRFKQIGLTVNTSPAVAAGGLRWQQTVQRRWRRLPAGGTDPLALVAAAGAAGTSLWRRLAVIGATGFGGAFSSARPGTGKTPTHGEDDEQDQTLEVHRGLSVRGWNSVKGRHRRLPQWRWQFAIARRHNGHHHPPKKPRVALSRAGERRGRCRRSTPYSAIASAVVGSNWERSGSAGPAWAHAVLVGLDQAERKQRPGLRLPASSVTAAPCGGRCQRDLRASMLTDVVIGRRRPLCNDCRWYIFGRN